MQTTHSNYKYPLEKHPAKKGTCPGCQKPNVFRHYEGFGKEFGICERINNCGYKNTPQGEPQEFPTNPLPAVKTIFPDKEYCNKVVENQSSNFHRFATETLKISPEHLRKWNCGTIGSDTVFVHQDKNKCFLNMVRINYLLTSNTEGQNCKRDKNKMPFSLKAGKGEKYSLCLYGEHLLEEGKIVCLVESEKTAIIASFFYPEFNWLATGGANKLTGEKIPVLFNREVYYIADADKAGKDNSNLKKLSAYQISYKMLDLFTDRSDGYDLADAIIDGLRPELKPEENIQPKKEKPVKQMKATKISVFEIVENFLTELYEIRYNEVSNDIERREKQEAGSTFQPLNEASIYRLFKHNHIKISQSDIAALMRSDFVPVYNPFEEYFNNLGDWDRDREADYIDKLCGYVQVKDQERFNRHFKKMLVRTVACAITKVYNKQAFILVHDKQNSGKSTFCRWLCPPALGTYIIENMAVDKDSQIALAENFLINMDELATIGKTNLDNLKAMFSRDRVKVRKPFDKKTTMTLRRASFVGSTNKTEFLTDETGSVRWLCFELTGQINWDYKNDIDINLIWKQAYTLFKEGFRYELTHEEVQENDLVNRQYQVQTVEMDLIQKYYLPGTKEDHQAFYTATDFLINLTEKYNNNVRLNTNNIGKALKFLGFPQSAERKTASYPVKGYYIKFYSGN